MTGEQENNRERDSLLHVRKLLEQQISFTNKLTDQKFDALKESIGVAKEAVDLRLEKLNELRDMVTEWRSTFEPVGGVAALKDEMQRRLGALEKDRAEVSGRSSAITATVGTVIGFVLVIVNVIASFVIQRWEQ